MSNISTGISTAINDDPMGLSLNPEHQNLEEQHNNLQEDEEDSDYTNDDGSIISGVSNTPSTEQLLDPMETDELKELLNDAQGYPDAAPNAPPNPGSNRQ